jgi:alpha-L-fucosidase
MEAAATSPAPGGNEVKSKPFTAADIRFTAKGDALYAFVMGWPEDGKVSIKSLRSGSPHLQKGISRVEFIGRGSPLAFKQTAEGLQITLPADRPALPYAFALKIA